MQEHGIVVLVPIYKSELDALERFSLDKSISLLAARKIFFIAPRLVKLDWYQMTYPAIPFFFFEEKLFISIVGYNKLMLDIDFYQRFADYEFMLILQTDAIVLRDELDYWCSQPFDYVGAPWPDGVDLLVGIDQFVGNNGRRVRAMVGNGGFSLRRIKKCISLLQEFPEAINYFLSSGSSEDLFFSFMGLLSIDFILPNEITASLFSLELKPSLYYEINGNRLPMGGHAWWKYEPEFWLNLLPDAPFTLQQ